MIAAILLATAAAAVFAAGTSLQHRAASAVPQAGTSAAGLLVLLARQPSWLAGLGFSAAAFGLHAVALHQGALSLVQPIVVSAIVFAVFIRSALDRRRPRRKEVWWAIGTWAGLTLLITGLPAGAARHAADEDAAKIFFAVGVVTAAVAVVWAHKTKTAARRGLLLGAAAGVSFGLIAGLLKMLIAEAQGPLAVLGQWSLWAMLSVGMGALLLNQQAYQAARLSVTMPILNIVDVLVALAFGAAVFGEQLFASPVRVTVAVLGLVVMGVGVWQLARQQEMLTSGDDQSHRAMVPAASSERP